MPTKALDEPAKVDKEEYQDCKKQFSGIELFKWCEQGTNSLQKLLILHPDRSLIGTRRRVPACMECGSNHGPGLPPRG